MKYKITYPLAGAIPALIAFVFFFLKMDAGLFYSACFAVLAGSTGIIIARVVMQNIVDKHNDPRTWQVTIYAVIALIGWVGAILAETWSMTSVFMCMVACGLLLCFGTRFLKDENGNGIPDIFEKKGKPEEISRQYLLDHMLFALKGDRLGGVADEERPLCPKDGKLYTVTDAVKAGYTELALAGTEYIDNLFNN